MRRWAVMPLASPLRTLLVATRLLGQALGHATRRATHTDTLAELRLTCAQLVEENALLRDRLARLPARQRPH